MFQEHGECAIVVFNLIQEYGLPKKENQGKRWHCHFRNLISHNVVLRRRAM